MHWYDVGTTLVYNTHFFAVYVIAAVLWARDRARWGAFVRRFLALTFAGLATYVLFPAAPPWMAAARGEIEPVSRISGKGWNALGLDGAASLLDKGQGIVNQVAAVPSLHAAFALFICVFFWRRARWPMRVVLVAYSLAMGFALVYAGEHYASDVLLGWLYVALVMAGVTWCERRWRTRRRPNGERETGLEPATLSLEGSPAGRTRNEDGVLTPFPPPASPVSRSFPSAGGRSLPSRRTSDSERRAPGIRAASAAYPVSGSDPSFGRVRSSRRNSYAPKYGPNRPTMTTTRAVVTERIRRRAAATHATAITMYMTPCVKPKKNVAG